MKNADEAGGWMERVKTWVCVRRESCPCRRYGLMIGGVLIVLGTILLYWNEMDMIRSNARMAEEMKAAEGTETVASMVPHTPEILEDPLFGVEHADALRLQRNVQYYQYVEEKKTKTSGEYEYRRQWVNHPINTSNFHTKDHECPPIAALGETVTVNAVQATLGKISLSKTFIETQKEFTPISLANLTPEQLQKTVALLKWHGKQAAPYPVHVTKTPNGNDEIFFGLDPAKPAVGDVRVSFAAVPMNAVKFTGTYASLLEKAVAADAPSSFWRWFRRFVGMFIVSAGILAMWDRIVVWSQSVPLIVPMVRLGSNRGSLQIGGAWVLLLIAIAQMLHEPWFALLCLALAFAFILPLLLQRNQPDAQPK